MVFLCFPVVYHHSNLKNKAKANSSKVLKIANYIYFHHGHQRNLLKNATKKALYQHRAPVNLVFFVICISLQQV